MIASARAAIRLLRAGTVPSSAIQELTVGCEDLDSRLRDRLKQLNPAEPTAPLFIHGEWGTGKTHSLQFAGAVAEADGHIVAECVLNARSRALNYPQRLIPVLSSSMRGLGCRGLQHILIKLMEMAAERDVAFALPFEPAANDLWYHLTEIQKRVRDGDSVVTLVHPAWRVITGADIAGSDYSYRRGKALDRLTWLLRVLAMNAGKKVVLLIDELETIDQLWNRRSRAAAYEALGRLTEMRGALCIFGITERFTSIVEYDLSDRIRDVCSPAAIRFLSKWRKGDFEIMPPPTVNGNHVRTLANAVRSLYLTGYSDCVATPQELQECVSLWRANPQRNPRRLIRSLIHELDLSRPLT